MDQAFIEAVGTATGMSALPNEILGDLSTNYGVEPENASELKLEQLVDVLDRSAAGLGKEFIACVNKTYARVLPGEYGLNKAKQYLVCRWMAGADTVSGC